MDSVMLNVGLDYHPASIRVCVLDDAGRVLVNQDCDNDWRAVADLARRHGVVRRAGIEACCGAADLAEELIDKARWPIDLAHPGLVRRMKNSPDKHDYGDAHILADLQRVGYLPKVWLRCGWRPRRCVSCVDWCVSASSWPTAAAMSSCASAPRCASCV
jgi:transposase